MRRYPGKQLYCFSSLYYKIFEIKIKDKKKEKDDKSRYFEQNESRYFKKILFQDLPY